jgi:hypothetical protein
MRPSRLSYILLMLALAVPTWAAEDLPLLDFAPAHQQPEIGSSRVPSVTGPMNGKMIYREDQRAFLTWGTHYEMGFAVGYELAGDVMRLANELAIGNTQYHLLDPWQYENIVLPFFLEKFFVPDELAEEAQGLYDGMVASGEDLTITALGREMTLNDVLCQTAVPELNSLFCSSVAGWGESTGNDTLLQGGYIIARNLDYPCGLNCVLGETSLILAYRPSDPGEIPWVNVTPPGMIGCLSCMNEYGLGASMNVGNHPDTGAIAPNSLEPIGWTLRKGVEDYDPDGDGLETVYDIVHGVIPSHCLSSWDIHLYSAYWDGQPYPPGAILEVNNLGDSLRTSEDNYLPPSIDSEWGLAVTNHDRVYYPPVPCLRYQTIAESLNADYHLSLDRAEAIANSVSWWYSWAIAGTVHQVAFLPNNGEIYTKYAGYNYPASTDDRVRFTWEELFPVVLLSLTPERDEYTRGDTLTYWATFLNAGPDTLKPYYRAKVALPNGKVIGPVVGPERITMPPDTVVTYRITHEIPYKAPYGTYTYRGQMGKPEDLWDQHAFDFTINVNTL